MAGLSGFSYYKAITISNTNVDADISLFPVYVPIVDDATIGGHCVGTNGYDVQFANSDNSEALSFERIYWNNPAGTANGDFYVLVPVVDGDAPTVIRCYYGKSGESDLSAPATVFNTTNNWVAVWHLEESGSGYLDATGNDNDSVAQVAPTRVAGKVGYGQGFANAEYIQIADSNSLDIGTADFSFSSWVKKTGTGVDYIFAHRNASSGAGVSAFFSAGVDPDRLGCNIEDADNIEVGCFIAPSDIAYNTWYHLAFTCDRDNIDGFVAYKNGAVRGDVDPTTAQLSLASNQPAYIGASSAIPGYPLTGILDEIRVSNIVRPAAWVKFECLNMDDGHAAGNELSWGEELGGMPETIGLIWTR